MSAFIACPPIERRHARQRIAKKPSRQVARLKLGAAIAIRQRQRTRPNARREREVSGLADASDVIHDFGHCSFPRTTSPMPQPYGTPAPWPNRDDGLSELRCLRPEVRQGREQRSNRETLTPHARRRTEAIPMRLDGQPSADDVARGAQVEVAHGRYDAAWIDAERTRCADVEVLILDAKDHVE